MMELFKWHQDGSNVIMPIRKIPDRPGYYYLIQIIYMKTRKLIRQTVGSRWGQPTRVGLSSEDKREIIVIALEWNL